MKRRIASALMFFLPCMLFLFNDEILSLLALSIMSVMCIGGILVRRAEI